MGLQRVGQATSLKGISHLPLQELNHVLLQLLTFDMS